MLQVCLNGGRLPDAAANLPITADELAADFAACVAAGADEAHLHPRGPDGLESLDADVMAKAVLACREVGRAFGVSTYAGIPGAHPVAKKIATWTDCPDYASVNLHEVDAPAVRAALEAKGIGTEAGVWTLADVPRLADGPPPLRILIEVQVQEPGDALAEADRILSALDRVDTQTPRLLHAENATAWTLLRRARALGLDTRIGLEDVLVTETGARASGNPALVAAALKYKEGSL